jgi:hypothetical protein
MRECLSDGRWYRVTYNRLSTPAGVRLDPRPVSYEDTGELCTPPPDARPPHAALTRPSTGTQVAQAPVQGGQPIEALVRDVETALANAQASLPVTATPPAKPATTLPPATLVLEPGAEPKKDASRISQLSTEAGVLVALGALLPENEVDELLDLMDALDTMPRYGFGGGMQRLDPPTIKLDDVDSDMQEESILDEIDEVLVLASSAPAEGLRHTLLALLRSPFAVLHAEEQASGVKILFTSLGVSSGEAFDVQVINTTGKPVQFKLASMVLQPLKKAAGERVAREFSKAAGKAVRVKMLGYCMQFLKLPPKAGTIFAAAPQQVQQQFTSASTIFNAARALNGRGHIKPPGAANPQAYFHSIRQWAWWTREQKFTEPTFTNAMLEYTKKNLANAKQPWTKEAEAYVRATAPKRWADIGSVLGLADRFIARKGGQ